MYYTPNNATVYLSAFTGCLSGLGASGRYLTDPNATDYVLYALMADAFAQQLDTLWGPAGPTVFEMGAIERASAAVWHGRSPLEAKSATVPGAYAGLAGGVVALVRQGSAQVAAQGVSGDSAAPVTVVSGAVPAAQQQPVWNIDPQKNNPAASDAADGIAVPLVSIAQVYRRWGTTNPDCTATPVTINFLSDQTSAWNDPVVLSAANSSNYNGPNIVGSLVQVATATIGTFTPRNRAAGTKNTITAAGAGASFWAPYVNYWVHDTTANAWFWVDADHGNATATISEPVQAANPGVIATPYVTIASGDALVIYRFTKVQVTSSSMSALGIGSLTHVWVTSANPAASTLRWDAGSLTECRVDTSIYTAEPAVNILAKNCCFTGPLYGLQATLINGVVQTNYPTLSSRFTWQAALDGDVLINAPSSSHAFYRLLVGRAYFAGKIDGPDLLFLGTDDANGIYYPDAVAWGPGRIAMDGGGQMLLANAPTQGATAMLLTGGFTLDGSSTGYPWVGGSTHAFGAAQNVTGANIDTYGSLQNPQTGTRIAKIGFQ